MISSPKPKQNTKAKYNLNQSTSSINVLHTARPVSITLRNQLPPTRHVNAPGSSSLLNLQCTCPLVSTRLEVFVDSHDNDDEVVLWEAEHVPALHSVWENVDQENLFSTQKSVQLSRLIAGDDDEVTEAEEDEIYIHTFVRVTVSKRELDEVILQENDESDEVDHIAQNEDATTNIKLSSHNIEPFFQDDDNDTIVLAEVSLHPSNLRRLPTVHASNMASLSAMPPNALIVRYTDDSIRVSPHCYNLLLERGIVNEKGINSKDYEHIKADLVEVDKRERRFNDAAFEVLEGNPSPSPYKSNGLKTNSSIFEDDAFSLLGDFSEGMASLQPRTSISNGVKGNGKSHNISVTKTRQTSSPGNTMNTAQKLAGLYNGQRLCKRNEDEDRKKALLEELSRQKEFLRAEDDAYQSELRELKEVRARLLMNNIPRSKLLFIFICLFIYIYIYTSFFS